MVDHIESSQNSPTGMYMKTCSTCKGEKSLSEFHKTIRNGDGHHQRCKVCANYANKVSRDKDPNFNRRNNLRRSFGMSLDEYQRLYDSQDGVCAICRKPESVIRAGKVLSLAVDHDHTSGRIRGLLCNNCNRGVGLFSDDTTIISRAVEYLRRERHD